MAAGADFADNTMEIRQLARDDLGLMHALPTTCGDPFQEVEIYSAIARAPTICGIF